MRSLALPLTLALAAATAVPVAAAPKNVPAKAPVVEARHQGDPELASLRRQLAAAVLVAKLELSADQKVALKKVIAEARLVREQSKKSDAEIAAFRAERKKALQAAIDEVHRTGQLSEATKGSFKDARKDAIEDNTQLREKMKSLKESVKGILTAQQLEKIQAARANAAQGKAGKFARKGMKGGAKGQLIRLMLSEEFEAELSR